MTPPSTPKAPKNILIFSPILLPIFIFSRNFCGKVLLLHVQQLICVCVWLCEPLLILRFGGRWICVYQAQEIVIQLHWLLTLIWIDWMQWLVFPVSRKFPTRLTRSQSSEIDSTWVIFWLEIDLGPKVILVAINRTNYVKLLERHFSWNFRESSTIRLASKLCSIEEDFPQKLREINVFTSTLYGKVVENAITFIWRKISWIVC